MVGRTIMLPIILLLGLLACSPTNTLRISASLTLLRRFRRDQIQALVASALEARSFAALLQLMEMGNNGLREAVRGQCMHITGEAFGEMLDFIEQDLVARLELFLSRECLARMRALQPPLPRAWLRHQWPPCLPPMLSCEELARQLEYYDAADGQGRWSVFYPLEPPLPWPRVIREGEMFYQTSLFSDLMHLLEMVAHYSEKGVGEPEIFRLITILEGYSLVNAGGGLDRMLPPMMAATMVFIERSMLDGAPPLQETLYNLSRLGAALAAVAQRVHQLLGDQHLSHIRALLIWAREIVLFGRVPAGSEKALHLVRPRRGRPPEGLARAVLDLPFAAVCFWTVLLWYEAMLGGGVRKIQITLARTVLLSRRTDQEVTKYLCLLCHLEREPDLVPEILEPDALQRRILSLAPEAIPPEVWRRPFLHYSPLVIAYYQRWLFSYDNGWYATLPITGQSEEDLLRAWPRLNRISYDTIPPARLPFAADGEDTTEGFLRRALELALSRTRVFTIDQCHVRDGRGVLTILQSKGSIYDEIVVVDLVILLILHYRDPPYFISRRLLEALHQDDVRCEWATICMDPWAE